MATQTTNYGLKKPDYNDSADIGVINSNMDIIDAKMKEIDDKAGSGGGGTSVIVDSELSTTSENPVQNKVITQELSAVNSSFDELKSDIDDAFDDKLDAEAISKGYEFQINRLTMWEQGQYYPTYPIDSAKQGSNNHIRLKNEIASNVKLITASGNYQFSVKRYNLDGSWAGKSKNDIQSFSDFDFENYRYSLTLYKNYASSAISVNDYDAVKIYTGENFLIKKTELDFLDYLVKKGADTDFTFDLYEANEWETGHNNGTNIDTSYSWFINTRFSVDDIIGDTLKFVGLVEDANALMIIGLNSSGVPTTYWKLSNMTKIADRIYTLKKPTTVRELVVNMSASYANKAIIQLKNGTDLDDYLACYNIKKSGLFAPWSGKKIAWIGTSIAFGQYATESYPNIASKLLSFDLINTAIPGISVEVPNDSYTNTISLSISELSERGITLADAPIPYVPNGSYNNYYGSYERIFSQENADVDLWVFATLPNNSAFSETDVDNFNFADWYYTDSSPIASHRSTYGGAMIFLLDKLYDLNPKARILFVVDSIYGYTGRNVMEKIATKAKIPYINLWGNIGANGKTANVYFIDNSSDWHNTTYCHEKMGEMLAGELSRI